MEEKQRYSLDEAHKHFAESIHGRVWELLQQPSRTDDESAEMLHAAHACSYHWRFVGTTVHQQRGEWLISHVHVVLGHGQEALRHAERCFGLTQSNKSLMKDFDFAYVFEGIARAQGLLGNEKVAKEFFDLARQAGDAIADEEDKSIFAGDFGGGEWYGLK